VAGDLKNKQESKKNGGDTGDSAYLNTTTETCKKILQRQGFKDRQHDKGGKSSTQSTKAAKHPPETITKTTMVAKHPPEQGGKASARQRPMQPRRC